MAQKDKAPLGHSQKKPRSYGAGGMPFAFLADCMCMSATPFGNNDLLPRSQSATWQISTLSRSSQEKICTAGGRDYCRRVFATSIILIVILIIIRLL